MQLFFCLSIFRVCNVKGATNGKRPKTKEYKKQLPKSKGKRATMKHKTQKSFPNWLKRYFI